MNNNESFDLSNTSLFSIYESDKAVDAALLGTGITGIGAGVYGLKKSGKIIKTAIKEKNIKKGLLGAGLYVASGALASKSAHYTGRKLYDITH